MKEVILKTDLPGIKLFKRGKVRDLYDLGDKLLIVCTDRISVFDCVLSEGIPLKGKILNQLSAFWFKKTENLISNHMISTDIKDFPSQVLPFKSLLEGRAMLVKKTRPIGVECVVRGYLSGSAYREYKEKGSVAEIPLPAGLKESDPLPSVIFTPAIKSSQGHDINISFKKMQEMVGKKLSETIKQISLKIYEYVSQFLDSRGFILADTKMEFGMLDGEILLIDELITPDSSRFWLKEKYIPGKHQDSFDKQFVRDYFETLKWGKNPPPPPLPPDIIEKTSKIYQDTYRRITGKNIS
ncbi:MAG TPA: phosphoribosylaminoimidazolesuccinocarboxamide synthase [Candidatus Aerophobetes bacterium]|uniref:Phosphoribosylaminoimidazole-succinocarboxamide synthase n=1 Tax=Aerophobetes bacterium TaxID=2030807 RepID=A0A7V0N265_UNCAE|nr:phosphoribosylaminoimidazolesuccinocarboxamide synthase [Candidatus Aerophobetes bacterium]